MTEISKHCLLLICHCIMASTSMLRRKEAGMADSSVFPLEDSAVIDEFAARLSGRDVEGVMALFAEDSAVVVPFQPPGFPTAMVGRAQIREALALLAIYEPAPFSMRVDTVKKLPQHGRWLAHLEGCMVVRATQRTYRNRYLANFRMEDGKIAHLTVLHNPLVQLASYDWISPDDIDDTRWEHDAVERYYDLLFAHDHASMLDMVTNDVEYSWPCHMPGLPDRIAGRDELRARALNGFAELWSPGGLAHIRIRPLATPHTWLADAEGDLSARLSGRPYRARFRGEIHFHHGKIARVTQFANPLDQIMSLGADIPGINAPGSGIDLAH
ncbi:nuclear transport factor 2 family protein [Nocardia transvalensis]|uniref:nuclear transport factor 2 family protein n=1 Tax=Nocardia transvalensis TaxID=37333 RepID=UPI00189433EE|nr:nuclear transport factor 2 family protein [Nocardia transvalensis]MBF6328478.1 nuclear transport factor 2 family protein [Nocardia transvalensis]